MVFLPHFPIPNKNSISDNSPKKLLKILEKFDNPQNKLPPVIHVAGTNGKGSVVAFLASIFKSANYKIHIYTSPHLHHCNERIVINGNQIDDGYLYKILEEIRVASLEIDLTLFEGLTLAAILAFSRNAADFCIIETGMGGRVDATNVIENKIATILTSISFDHQEFLGNNLSAIAAEKSYIMRTSVPCIVAPQEIEAMKMIEIRAAEIDAPLIKFGKDFKIEINENESWQLKVVSGQKIEFFNLLKPALPGFHQYLNASLAIVAIKLLLKKPGSQDEGQDIKVGSLNDAAINDGLKQVKWPSRLEKINYKLPKKNDELWIDGAHNQGGFNVLADWLKEKVVDDFENNQPKRNYLITGFTKGKSKSEFFSPFKDLIDFICAIRVAGEPNPEEAQAIVEKILLSGIEGVKSEDDLLSAINLLANLDQENPCRIIICGSLYLARDLKKIINYNL